MAVYGAPLRARDRLRLLPPKGLHEHWLVKVVPFDLLVFGFPLKSNLATSQTLGGAHANTYTLPTKTKERKHTVLQRWIPTYIYTPAHPPIPSLRKKKLSSIAA
jgi:hypothetical protein